jgi:N-acetylneuraminate synthase
MNFKKYISNCDPYLIAEIGVNHENSLTLAEKIIKQAKDGGANAVKFQTYKAETIASKFSPYYWDLKKVKDQSQYKLFKKFDKFNEEHYIKLKKICTHYKIDFLSTGFDKKSIIFLNKLVKFFKIASADLTNLMLIDEILKCKKPIMLSTGASNLKEITKINKYIEKKNPKIDLAILHCILSYPTSYDDANLGVIKLLKNKFKSRIIGYSDHTMPDESSLVLFESYKAGAMIIEKHFTLDKLKGKKGNDHFHSMDFNDFKKLRLNINLSKRIEGKSGARNVLKCEIKSRRNARRSMYTLGNLKKNTVISEKNIIPKRPGGGISPIYYKKMLGKKILKNLKDDYKLTWKDLK